MKNKDVIFLCGDYPENHITPEIGNDPNYIFLNDPNYEQVRLFDEDGNTVLVNSFIECEHYVLGGWDNSPAQFNEISFHNSLSLIIAGAIIIRYLLKKIYIRNNAKT